MGLEDIVSNNHYPIIFIGSGISKRYLANSPTWGDLLEEYWNKLDTEQNFYSYLHELNEKFSDEDSNEIEFHTNVHAASRIEKLFNEKFYQEKLSVPDLSIKDAQQKHIFPFKFDLANRFSSLKFKADIDNEEFVLFRKMLQKSRVIVTTNYDPLIEQTVKRRSSQKPKIYIGHSGFFDDDSEGWSEIYKIHGSSNNPNSIIITEKDYQNYDKNSILISAKILSSMIDSPILFLGYSLKDRNVRFLLKDFSKQLPAEDSRKSANRIFVVERNKGEQNIQEQIIQDPSLNFTYTHIQTDNYKRLYSEICKIDEGVSPYEVRRFQKVIKKIIVSSGQKRALDSYLVRPTDLNALESKIEDGKPIVVALGDTKHIFVTPTPTECLSDYILEKFDLLPENALRFIAREQSNGRYPFLKHYQNVNLEECSLETFEKENIRNRLKRDEKDFNCIKNKIPPRNMKKFDRLEDIILLNTKLANKIDFITYNSDHLDRNEFSKYVKEDALPAFIEMYKKRDSKNGNEKSAYRKLFVAWDILTYGE